MGNVDKTDWFAEFIGEGSDEGFMQKYLSGTADPKQVEAFENHYLECEDCLDRVVFMRLFIKALTTSRGAENLERKPFPEGRISNSDALTQLEQATGIAPAKLLSQIPELKRDDLAFGIRWASEGYEDSEIGKHNAEEVSDYILVYIPELNAVGDQMNNMDEINRSYYINVTTFEIQGSSGFHEAEDSLWKRPDLDIRSKG